MLFGGKRSLEQVDIIIPAYKPDGKFLELMEQLARQTVPVHQIIIMNTEQKYFDRLLYGTSFSKTYKNVLVKHLSKREFDHGRTRNKGVSLSDAPVFVMMTQDAVPTDEFMLEELLRGLLQENVAVSYGRQLAEEFSSEPEKLARSFNYPEQGAVKTKADFERLGIKTYFCSNVCAAYKREIFDSLGGFIRHTIFNEDMVYAAGAVEAGYGIAYCPKAKVYHSHNYTKREHFHRYFNLGVSQADHPEIFKKVSSESEGGSLVRLTVETLWKERKKRQIPGFILETGFKYIGYLAGKHYHSLPWKLVVKCSADEEYWNQDQLLKAGSSIDPTKGYGKSEEERNQ